MRTESPILRYTANCHTGSPIWRVFLYIHLHRKEKNLKKIMVTVLPSQVLLTTFKRLLIDQAVETKPAFQRIAGFSRPA